MPVSGLSGSTPLQQTQTAKVDELQNKQKTDEAKKAQSTTDAGKVDKTDKTGAKDELAKVVKDDTKLTGKAAENFAESNTVKPGEKKTVTEEKKTDKSEKKEGTVKSDKKEETGKSEKKEEAGKSEKKEGADTKEVAKKEPEKATKAEKSSGGSVADWYDDHPRFKLAMQIVDKVLEAVINAMEGVAKSLPDGVGDCVTGGLSLIRGFACTHELDNFEGEKFDELVKQVKDGGQKVFDGITTLVESSSKSDPTPTTEDKDKKPTETKKPAETKTETESEHKEIVSIINCTGTACSKLSKAEGWEDTLTAVAEFALDLAGVMNPDTADITGAVKSNLKNFTAAIKHGVEGIKTAMNEDKVELENDAKTTKALELFEKTLLADKSLSEDEKNLVKTLSKQALKMIKAKGSKETLAVYEDTIGATASAVLKGKNKEIADMTFSLMKEIRAEKDPFKAASLVFDKAMSLAGAESKEVKEIKKTLDDAGKIVEKAKDKSVPDAKMEEEVKKEVSKTVAEVVKKEDAKGKSEGKAKDDADVSKMS